MLWLNVRGLPNPLSQGYIVCYVMLCNVFDTNQSIQNYVPCPFTQLLVSVIFMILFLYNKAEDIFSVVPHSHPPDTFKDHRNHLKHTFLPRL